MAENHNKLYSDHDLPLDSPEPVIIQETPSQNNTDVPCDTSKEHEFQCQYYFPSIGDPEIDTGTYSSTKAFAPTMLFHLDELVTDENLNLAKIFPIKFPFGVGTSTCARINKVSNEECLKNYLKLSLPRFSHPDFILVISHVLNRIYLFRCASLRCRANMGDEKLAEKVASLTEDHILGFINEPTHEETIDNSGSALHTLLHTITAASRCVGHSNEAVQVARNKVLSMWVSYGAPSLFFTASPCDECSSWVKLLATCTTQHLPDVSWSSEQCLSDLQPRQHLGQSHPGVCAMEFENIIQIVIRDLIGWDLKKRVGRCDGGIFGLVEALAEFCEDQARKMLPSRMMTWVKSFNVVRNLLFSEDSFARNADRESLTNYMKKFCLVLMKFHIGLRGTKIILHVNAIPPSHYI